MRFAPFLAILGLTVAVAALGSLERARADDTDPRTGQSLPDDEIGIVNLSDQDVSPRLRDCLQHNPLGECLKKQLGDPSPQKKTGLIDRVGNAIDESLVGAWRNFLYNSISPGQTVYQTHGVGFYFGIQVGGNRIDMDHIALDPNMLATERALGGQDVWVKHEFELLPQVGYGYNPQGLSDTTSLNDQYVGALFTLNSIMRITKLHPMNQVYNENFWGYARQDLKIIGQSFPMYLKVSSHLDGKDLLPGEGIEFERYGAIGLGVGPSVSLTGISTPVSITTAQAGIFGSAGLVVLLARGHYRTTMEKQIDGTLRLTLSHIKEDSEMLQGQIGIGAAFGPISYVYNLARIEDGVQHTSETILDMNIDPKYPQALKALYHAYLGFFGTAQGLADHAATDYEGVRYVDHTGLTQTTHDRNVDFPFYHNGTSQSETHVVTTPDGTPAEAPSENTIESMSQHRNTHRSGKDIQVSIDSDDGSSDPATHRSLGIRLRFQSHNATPRELRMFLDLARLLAPDQNQQEIADWLHELDSDHPGSKRGELQGYFYLSFDPSALTSLFEIPDSMKASDLLVNWAKVLQLPNPEAWATMTPGQQDAAAAGFRDQLKHLRDFSKSLLAALQIQDLSAQERAFDQAVRSLNYDLYPLAALAIPVDHSHLLSLERITLGKDQDAHSLEFASIGTQYQFPVKLP